MASPAPQRYRGSGQPMSKPREFLGDIRRATRRALADAFVSEDTKAAEAIAFVTRYEGATGPPQMAGKAAVQASDGQPEVEDQFAPSSS